MSLDKLTYCGSICGFKRVLTVGSIFLSIYERTLYLKSHMLVT